MVYRLGSAYAEINSSHREIILPISTQHIKRYRKHIVPIFIFGMIFVYALHYVSESKRVKSLPKMRFGDSFYSVNIRNFEIGRDKAVIDQLLGDEFKGNYNIESLYVESFANNEFWFPSPDGYLSVPYAFYEVILTSPTLLNVITHKGWDIMSPVSKDYYNHRLSDLVGMKKSDIGYEIPANLEDNFLMICSDPSASSTLYLITRGVD